MNLTSKQIAILESLAKRSPVVAPWTNRDLTCLEQMRFVQAEAAYQATGKLSSNKVWTITDAGRRFLNVERGVN